MKRRSFLKFSVAAVSVPFIAKTVVLEAEKYIESLNAQKGFLAYERMNAAVREHYVKFFMEELMKPNPLLELVKRDKFSGKSNIPFPRLTGNV